MADATMTITQKMPYKLAFVDSSVPPKPAVVDGIPVVTVDNPALASVVADADGMGGFIVAMGIGDVIMTSTGDADMDPNGVPVPIVATKMITITGAVAAAETITFGAPVAQ